jgi:hypothetical protein
MGQQQLIMIILGVIIVGIAIAVGISLFFGTSVTSNRDAIVNDMLNIGQYAYRYKLRPEPLGGGGRSYIGLFLPADLADNDNAKYTYETTPSVVTLTATSKFGYGTVVVLLDSTGNTSNFTYTGNFSQ